MILLYPQVLRGFDCFETGRKVTPVANFGRSGNLAADMEKKLEIQGVQKFLGWPHRQKEFMQKVYAHVNAIKAGSGKGRKGGTMKGSAMKADFVIADRSSPPAED